MAESTAHSSLDFEREIVELEGKIEELRHLSDDGEIRIADEVERLQARVNRLIDQTYSRLTPWQRVQVARHPSRPHCVDYIEALIDEFTPLAGDRAYGEDHAIVGGLGRLDGRAVVLIGQEKGADTDTRLKHNFGMARPEGYRKARRLMELADRFGLPIVTLVDTSGAYPGVGAEERGQAEAIARAIEAGLRLRVPVVSVVIGEGGSGGAIAIAVANRVLMLEHAVYSVISPEGCASILWRDAAHATEAATALKMTAADLLGQGVIDAVIPEPPGAAHRSPDAAIAAVGKAVSESLAELARDSGDALRLQRREKFLRMGGGG